MSLIRYSLLAAFCYERNRQILDTLIELLISIIHKIGSRAEHRVNKEVIREIRRVQGKTKLLYDVASASLDNPEGKVKEIIYPVAPEQTLRDVIQEFKLSGSYDQQLQILMRGSYGNHYRRMVPVLLKTLTICQTNPASKPLITALDLIRKYADKNGVNYPDTEIVPLQGIVSDKWLPMVKQGQHINRISYELCVLRVARDKIRCREIYAKGAYRYRNPNEDLPAYFDIQRTEYYADLHKPLSADEFIEIQKQDMKAALAMFDRGMPKTKKIEFTTKKVGRGLKSHPLTHNRNLKTWQRSKQK